MQADLRALLVGAPAIAAMVPSAAIRWNMIAQGIAGPAIVLWHIGGGVGYTMGGVDGLSLSRVQADIRTPDSGAAPGAAYTQATEIAAALKAAVSGFSGMLGATRFQLIQVLSERHVSEKVETVLYHRISIDLSVWHAPAD